MKITYDKEVDALAIDLASGEVCETREIAPGFHVDYGPAGKILTIEILSAGKQYDLTGIGLEAPSEFLSLASAAEMYGISATTLRHQIHNGALRGHKAGGRNWMVQAGDIEDYMTHRSRKRPAASRV